MMLENIFVRLNSIRNPFCKFSLSKHKKILFKRIMSSILVIYGFLLGLSTILDWNGDSDKIKKNFFIVLIFRIIFTSIFAFDWTLIICTLPKLTLAFIIDTVILLVDIASVIHSLIVFSYKDYRSDSVDITIILSILALPRLYKLCLINTSLITLSKSILVSIRSLIWAAFFLFVVLYTSAIFATWTFNKVDNDEMYQFWGTLFKSMFTLFTVLTLEGWNTVAINTAYSYPNSKLFFVLFVCFVTIAIMNVVTGIIFEAYMSISQKLSIGKHLERRKHIKSKISKLFKSKKSKGGNKNYLMVPNTIDFNKKMLNVDNSAKHASMGDNLHNIKINISPTSSPNLSYKIGPRISDQNPLSHNIKSQLSCLSNYSAISLVSGCSENVYIPNNDPQQALSSPAISRIIQDGEISEVQALDVLELMSLNGIQNMSAYEFTDACTRLSGSASNRQLLALEFAIYRRFNQLESLINASKL